MHQSHTSTEQWQSFELRMRQRRVQRCLLRASDALEARKLVEARAALEEARQLAPASQEVSELAARLAAASSAPVGTGAGRRYLVAAAALLVLAAGTSWFWVGLPATRTGPSEPAIAGSSLVAPGPEPLPVALMPEAAAPAPDAPAADAPAREVSAPDQTGPPAPEAAVKEAAVPAVRSAPAAGESPAGTTGARSSGVRTVATGGTDGEPSSQAGTAASRESGPPKPSAGPPVQRATASAARPAATRPPGPEPARPASLVAELPPPALDLSIVSGPPPDPLSARPAAAPDTPAAAPAPDTPAAAPAAPERLVRAALNRYQAAYSELDAAAAGAVWPAVDRQALARAFDGLAFQRVTLGRCDVRVNGPAATAECTGQARWTPKVGGGTQTAARRWQFELTDTGDAWIITQAIVR